MKNLRTYGTPPFTVAVIHGGPGGAGEVAWLSYLVAAQYPQLVKKLILVSSGPFEERYRLGAQEIRLGRLSEEDRAEVQALSATLSDVDAGDKNQALRRFGTLMGKADAYDALPDSSESIECRADIFAGVWPSAAQLRRSGELLRLGESIKCPVVAIHGDYDPHPAAGVQKPLSGVLDDFRFILLEKCGHKPWIERNAKDAFYQILNEEIRSEH